MTKKELIKSYADYNNKTMIEAKNDVNMMLSILANELLNEHEVSIRDFGKFTVVERKSSKRKSVKFVASRPIKEQLNKEE